MTDNLKLSRRLPILSDLSAIKIIRNQMRYNRDLEIRKKVMLFLTAFRYGNISLACLKLGHQGSYFCFWFNRLKQASFNIKPLEGRSRRPVSHPMGAPVEIADKIIAPRKQTSYGPDRLQFHLQSLYGIYLPQSTIGHIYSFLLCCFN
jgi:hypothetical protein